MALATRALLAIGTVIAVTVVGTAGYFAVGGNAPGARDCPGGLVGADIGGPFTLTSHTGQRMTDRDLAGEPTLLYFGYATCPDVCPTELADIAAAADIVSEKTDMTVNPVFITVDPKRDTPENLAEYVPYFHDSMIGLTGTEEEIRSVTRNYRVYYAESPDEDFPDGYAMDHSSFIYLLGKDANFITYFKYEDNPERIAEGVACHLRS
jgi:protein SCO1/2